METKSLILLEQFCTQLNAEPAFIFALQEYELVEIIEIEATQYLPEEQLSEVEKMLVVDRLHVGSDECSENLFTRSLVESVGI